MSHSENSVPPGGDDVAPGITGTVEEGLGRAVQGYVIGLILAAGLTVISFLIAGTGVVWGPVVPLALLVFAIAQMGVHLVFFLHITSGPENTNNTLALMFGVLIVVLVVGGSVWIMGNLNHNMIPMQMMTGMQP